MDCDQNVVRLTYKQLKELAEGSSHEEVAVGVCKLAALMSFVNILSSQLIKWP